MEKGDAFLMGVVGGTKKHLFIVISDPRKHHGCGVIVNVSTDKARAGGACLLAKGEHPWLTEAGSWVCYGDATLMTPDGWARIQVGISKRFIVPQARLSQGCVDRIVKAAKTSKAFPSVYLKYLD
jgi:hypothetical protein